MFLFAKLVMTNLYEQATKQDVDEELEPGKFPEGLRQASVYMFQLLRSLD